MRGEVGRAICYHPSGDRQRGGSLVREACSKSSKRQPQIGGPKSLAFYDYLAAPWSRQGRSDGSSRPAAAGNGASDGAAAS
jgi:hypothetical protein